jgi:hypothetical protein
LITKSNSNPLIKKWIEFYQKLILELEKSDCSTWDEINHYLDENDGYDWNDRTWSKYLDNSRNYKPFQLTAEIDSEGKVSFFRGITHRITGTCSDSVIEKFGNTIPLVKIRLTEDDLDTNQSILEIVKGKFVSEKLFDGLEYYGIQLKNGQFSFAERLPDWQENIFNLETIPSEKERKISEFSELLKETYLECLKDKKQAEQFAHHFPMLQNGVEFILSNY